jgi:hypothetical protein
VLPKPNLIATTCEAVAIDRLPLQTADLSAETKAKHVNPGSPTQRHRPATLHVKEVLMMRRILFAAVTGLSVLSLPDKLPGAPLALSRANAAYREEMIIGPFRHEHEAHAEARRLRERGWRTEVFHGRGPRGHGWHVKAWKP